MDVWFFDQLGKQSAYGPAGVYCSGPIVWVCVGTATVGARLGTVVTVAPEAYGSITCGAQGDATGTHGWHGAPRADQRAHPTALAVIRHKLVKTRSLFMVRTPSL